MDTALFLFFFFNTQLSWFSQNTLQEGVLQSAYYLVFLRSTYLPLSRCWQHRQLAFHSPSWLVPFIPELGNLQTSYQDSFCTFNLNFLPITPTCIIQPYHETSAGFPRIKLTFPLLMYTLGTFYQHSCTLIVWKVDLLPHLKDGELLRASQQLPEVKGRHCKASL